MVDSVIRKNQLPLLVGALIALGSMDYFAAASMTTSIEQSSTNLRLMHQQQMAELKKHIQLCSLTETIMSLVSDSGVAMGGYSITKDKMFSERFDKIAEVMPKKVQELKQLVTDNPSDEKLSTEAILNLTNLTLQTHRETKKLIDDPTIDVDQFRNRHVYRGVRANAEGLKTEIQNLREKDLARIEGALSAKVPEKNETGSFQIFLLAIFNAISGGAMTWLFFRK